MLTWLAGHGRQFRHLEITFGESGFDSAKAALADRILTAMLNGGFSGSSSLTIYNFDPVKAVDYFPFILKWDASAAGHERKLRFDELKCEGLEAQFNQLKNVTTFTTRLQYSPLTIHSYSSLTDTLKALDISGVPSADPDDQANGEVYPEMTFASFKALRKFHITQWGPQVQWGREWNPMNIPRVRHVKIGTEFISSTWFRLNSIRIRF